jgi:hypothetical protein
MHNMDMDAGAELAVWMMYAQLNNMLPVYLEAPPR